MRENDKGKDGDIKGESDRGGQLGTGDSRIRRHEFGDLRQERALHQEAGRAFGSNGERQVLELRLWRFS